MVGSLVVAAAALIPFFDSAPAPAAAEATTPRESSAPGISADTITVGLVHLDIPGYEDYSDSVAAGHEAYWDAVNDAGGVDGRTVVIDVRRSVSSSNASDAIDEAATATAFVASSLGTLELTHGLSAVPVIADSPISVDLLGDSIVLDAGYTSYAAEIAAGVPWAFTRDGPSLPPDGPVAFFRFDDSYGIDCANGMAVATDLAGLTDVTEVVLDRNASDHTADIERAIAHEPYLVVICTTPQELMEVEVRFAEHELYPDMLVTSASYAPAVAFLVGGGSDTSDPDFEGIGLGTLGGRTWVASSVPAWDAPEMASLRQRLAAYDGLIDDGFLLGWSQAATAHAALEQAARAGDLSRDGIRAALLDGVTADVGWGEAVIGLRLLDRVPLVPVYVLTPTRLAESPLGLAQASSGPIPNPYAG